jgi:hypothetical protein
MAEQQRHHGSFLSESISIKRWRLYSVQFTGLCLGWLAIRDIMDVSRHKLVTAFLLASAVCIFNYWSDLKRAAVQATKSETQI